MPGTNVCNSRLHLSEGSMPVRIDVIKKQIVAMSVRANGQSPEDNAPLRSDVIA